jgi:hypothetical protein
LKRAGRTSHPFVERAWATGDDQILRNPLLDPSVAAAPGSLHHRRRRLICGGVRGGLRGEEEWRVCVAARVEKLGGGGGGRLGW